MQSVRVQLARWRGWDIFLAAVAGYGVAHFLAFFGPVLLALAVRGLLQPLVATWTLSRFDRDGFHLATSLSWMLATLLLAPLIGLLSAACSRPLGMWRIPLPAIAFVVMGIVGFHTVAMLSHGPYPDEEARVAVSAVHAGFTLQGIVSLGAAVPAALGAWLGTKLWPARRLAAGPPSPDGPPEDT